jgi:hypothetical protein
VLRRIQLDGGGRRQGASGFGGVWVKIGGGRVATGCTKGTLRRGIELATENREESGAPASSPSVIDITQSRRETRRQRKRTPSPQTDRGQSAPIEKVQETKRDVTNGQFILPRHREGVCGSRVSE